MQSGPSSHFELGQGNSSAERFVQSARVRGCGGERAPRLDGAGEMIRWMVQTRLSPAYKWSQPKGVALLKILLRLAEVSTWETQVGEQEKTDESSLAVVAAPCGEQQRGLPALISEASSISAVLQFVTQCAKHKCTAYPNRSNACDKRRHVLAAFRLADCRMWNAATLYETDLVITICAIANAIAIALARYFAWVSHCALSRMAAGSLQIFEQAGHRIRESGNRGFLVWRMMNFARDRENREGLGYSEEVHYIRTLELYIPHLIIRDRRAGLRCPTFPSASSVAAGPADHGQ
ncbi:hypothetical protein MYCTH_91894 [Thermothelomyces thermophilus ATCC 42464]|uniref:Uncharacterized protein n=1 Tax=Thermothelomyces thermophilus (strain ATCC 42464 / BCRC 31852 / DSM 1799) TaxID=573729 RepID=G2Q474_THET4|nr:uncharacterized protein MYCTH_91894 [Thermothelomyces thermophilus ATCC 42464]AEO54469.1 hypothetical protein MYCTH_91894 [Thermothelomyces thermophilus ATCC 42464]